MRFHPGLAAALMFAATPAAIHAQAADPGAQIGAYDDAVIAIMKQKLGLSARLARFEVLVRDYYDMPAIAALVVGPKWAASPPAERSAATAALTRHSALQLARNFTAFDGEKFVVDPNVVSRGANRIVKVTIVSRGGGRDLLLYQLRQGAGGWKIVDVISGGVSQLAVQRSDAAAIVAGGGAAALAQRLGKLDAVK